MPPISLKLSKLSALLAKRPNFRRTSGKVKGGSDDLRTGILEIKSNFEEIMPDLEKQFLEIGERIEKVDASGKLLIDACEKLLNLASGGTEGANLLKEALVILKGPLEYIDFCMERQQELFTLLGSCEKKTHGMLSVKERMHDAIAPLTFMAVLFKIESAYLPPDLRETFLTVTLEVERLHKLVDETFTQNALQLEDAHATLKSVRSKLEEDFNRQTKHIILKRETIQKAITALDIQMSNNTERDSRLHSHDQALSSEIAKVVIGLQFQDIIKQKCDHIVEALVLPRGVCPSDQMITLQGRQLDSVANDLRGGCESIEAGLGRIGDFTEQLNHSSVSLENFESMTAAVDGMVQLLLDTLSDVHDIIRMISNLTEQGYHAVQPANGIARNLTSAILELSINMQLIALNAQIRSVQSGQGTGLEVLAARTAEISVQINEISEGISGELSLLHSSIDEMLGVFGQFRDQGTEQLKALEAARGDTEKRLHALRDKTLVAVQEIAEDVERVHSSVGEAKDSLSGLPVLCAKLQESAQLLKRLQGVHDSSPIADKALQTHAAKYTMASEREVHDELIGINAGTLSKSNSTPSPVLDALFSEEEKYSAPLAASAGEQLPKGDKPKQAMGDNVELF